MSFYLSVTEKILCFITTYLFFSYLLVSNVYLPTGFICESVKSVLIYFISIYYFFIMDWRFPIIILK